MLLRSLTLIVPLLLALLGCKSDPEAARQRLLEVGNKYFDSGKFKEASIIYRKAIQEDRRFGEAYYRLGLVELELQRFRGALGALTRAAELNPESEEVYAKLADLYLTIYFSETERSPQWLSEINQVTERAERYFPDSFEVNRIKGYVALAQQDFETAVARLRAAASEKPDDGRVMLGLAESLDGLGDFDEAERLARAFIERNKSYGAVYDFLYARYFGRNRRDDALEILKAKCDSDPSQILYWIQLARHYYVTEDRQKMTAVTERLLNDPEQYPNAFRHVGDLFMRIREFDNALEVYARAVDALPDRRSEFSNRMVEALALQGKKEEAFQLVEQVLSEDSENAVARALRGSLRLQSGDEKELQAAIADFQAVLASMPDNVVLRFSLAEAYLANHERDRAIVEYQEAIKRRPDYLPARHGLARTHMLNGDHAKAVAAAEETLSRRAGDLTARLLRAVAWISLGERKQARSSLEEILKQTPDAALPMYYLARLNLIEDRLDEAEKLYSRLYEKNPQNINGVLGLVEARLAQGRRNEALQLLQVKADEDPNNMQWRRAIALAANRVGDAERAVRELEVVLSANPDDAVAHRQLGAVYYGTGQTEEADRHFERAMELDPDDFTAYLYMGMTLEGKGQLQEAAAYYEKVLELAPDNLIALNNLAYILSETTSDLDRALTLVQRARSRVPEDPNIADTLSWIYIKKNLNENAILILGELLSKYPKHVTWRYHLATALFQKGDIDRAREELETALRNNPTEDEKGKIQKLLARVNI